MFSWLKSFVISQDVAPAAPKPSVSVPKMMSPNPYYRMRIPRGHRWKIMLEGRAVDVLAIVNYSFSHHIKSGKVFWTPSLKNKYEDCVTLCLIFKKQVYKTFIENSLVDLGLEKPFVLQLTTVKKVQDVLADYNNAPAENRCNLSSCEFPTEDAINRVVRKLWNEKQARCAHGYNPEKKCQLSPKPTPCQTSTTSSPN
jgi:hypothetical protein